MPMADAKSPEPVSGFPPPNFPTVFADAVMSMANTPTTVKFYLSRFEPDFAGGGQSVMQAFAQVVMPMDGFTAAFVFFEAQVKAFVRDCLISQARLDEFRKNLGTAV